MLRINFIDAEELLDGIGILTEELGFEISKNASITVKADKINEDKLIVSLRDNYITVSYKEKARFFQRACILHFVA
jgi:hypothetical protein